MGANVHWSIGRVLRQSREKASGLVNGSSLLRRQIHYNAHPSRINGS